MKKIEQAIQMKVSAFFRNVWGIIKYDPATMEWKEETGKLSLFGGICIFGKVLGSVMFVASFGALAAPWAIGLGFVETIMVFAMGLMASHQLLHMEDTLSSFCAFWYIIWTKLRGGSFLFLDPEKKNKAIA